ncbi:MAG: hypothetical protein ACREKN_01520 [Longimicrobiaceae bacterium]
MHIFLRQGLVRLKMRRTRSGGVSGAAPELVPVAFFSAGNRRPSFRAMLPRETLGALRKLTSEPVQLALLAEEPEQGDEVRAMVGVVVPVEGESEAMGEGAAPEQEPWRESLGEPEAWRGEESEHHPGPGTALLAFAPLVRLARKHPDDFGAELADLLENALAGATRPALEARVDNLLEEL